MRFIVFLFLMVHTGLFAQTVTDLTAWISVVEVGASCEIRDEFNDPNVVVLGVDNVDCVCGATGRGIYFDGSNGDIITFTGSKVDNTFRSNDFTLSFYFKPDEDNSPNATPQILFDKRRNCGQDTSFVVKYFPGGTRQLSVELIQDQTISASLFAALPEYCWHHITIVRRGAETILFHNGIELKRASTINGTRVDLGGVDNERVTIGNSDCNQDGGFVGVMDEIRLYNRALSRDEIEDLYLFPDNIANGLRFDDLKDTTIFLGGAVPIRLTETCTDNFDWFPTTGVSDPTISNPILSPEVSTTYRVEMSDTICVQIDSIFIEVINRDSVKCGDIFLPTAFTPNGDGLNDLFGVSNPFSTGEILAFQIYDRWGNIVFSTLDVLEKWDGTHRGQPVNPGVFLYKLQFRCEQQEDLISGSVTVIR
ncbi:MAG: LamG-like jellyroll fold domain-containing protein [Bacteroidota bacterium]